MTNRGSCLCKRVTYEIAGELTDVVNCHCSMCRKLHAAAFRTRATVATNPQVKATRHIFVGSKAPWFDITDDLPQHQEY
jgi:hypothetical protein